MQSDIACTNQFKCHVNQICSNDIDRWATLKRCFLEIISSLGRGLLGGTKPQKKRITLGLTIKQVLCVAVLVTCWQCVFVLKIFLLIWSSMLMFLFLLYFSSNECSSHISTYKLGHSLRGKMPFSFHIPKKGNIFLKDFCKVISWSLNLFFLLKSVYLCTSVLI